MALRKRALISGGIIALFIAGVLAGVEYPKMSVWLASPSSRPVVLSADPDCNPVNESCTAQGEAIAITLRLEGEVRPLKVFDFELSLVGQDAVATDEISVRFDMVDMNMGFNRFSAGRQSAHVWRGQAILPMCNLGRQDWRVTVTVAGSSHPSAGRFFFTANH